MDDDEQTEKANKHFATFLKDKAFLEQDSTDLTIYLRAVSPHLLGGVLASGKAIDFDDANKALEICARVWALSVYAAASATRGFVANLEMQCRAKITDDEFDRCQQLADLTEIRVPSKDRAN